MGPRVLQYRPGPENPSNLRFRQDVVGKRGRGGRGPGAGGLLNETSIYMLVLVQEMWMGFGLLVRL